MNALKIHCYLQTRSDERLYLRRRQQDVIPPFYGHHFAYFPPKSSNTLQSVRDLQNSQKMNRVEYSNYHFHDTMVLSSSDAHSRSQEDLMP